VHENDTNEYKVMKALRAYDPFSNVSCKRYRVRANVTGTVALLCSSSRR